MCPADKMAPRTKPSRRKPPRRNRVLVEAEALTPCLITFTGDRRHNRYRVNIRQHAVNLTAASLNVLIDLVLRRDDSPTGFVRLPAVDVFRLRKAVDSVLGHGAGKDLIETGGGEEYCLAIPRSELGRQVDLRDSFLELVDLKVISASQCKKLRRLCKSRNRAETRLKSK